MNDLIRAYVAHLRAGGCSAATLRARRQILSRVDDELPHGIENAAAGELALWLGQDQEWARWTCYTYFEAIAAFYAWATRGSRPHLDWNPTLEMMRPRIPRTEARPASEEQLAVAMSLRRPWRTAVILAAFNGLRCAEICALQRDEVRPDTMTVHRKGGKVMELPTHAEVWREIVDLAAGPVVATRTGRPFGPAHLSGAVSAALKRAGVPITLHKFRSRFACLLLLPVELGGAGVDVRTVQDLLGHESLNSTQIYTRTTDRQRRHAMTTLPVPAAALSQAA